MDRAKLKMIYKNLKSLCNALESEIYSDPEAYITHNEEGVAKFQDGYDDDGDPD
jgi:hypothetical protein